MQDNGAHDPVGADAFIRPQKFDEILWRGQGLACRLGRCFCILPYAEVSTGDPHLGAPLKSDEISRTDKDVRPYACELP